MRLVSKSQWFVVVLIIAVSIARCSLRLANAEELNNTALELKRTHVRSNEGIPFPRTEEVVLAPPPPFPPLPTSVMIENPPQPEYHKPPKCERSETTREALLDPDGSKDELVLSDVLYIPEHLVPLDPQEVLGSKVVVYPYGPNSGQGINIRMYYDNVPCVPYRIRSTNKARYFDRGDVALNNFDQQPSGRGRRHAWMQKQLFGIK